MKKQTNKKMEKEKEKENKEVNVILK